MMLAFRKMMENGQLAEYPISGYVAAVSAGVVDDVPMLDLCYEEDSSAMVDLNCIMDDQGRLIEIQHRRGPPLRPGGAAAAGEAVPEGH